MGPKDRGELGLRGGRQEDPSNPIGGVDLPAGDLEVVSRWATGDTAVVSLAGELDIATVHVVEKELSRIERCGPARLVLDLRRLQFMDSTGPPHDPRRRDPDEG